MTIKEAIETLLRAEEKEKKSVFNEESLCVGLARLGSESQKIAFGKAARVKDVKFGAPPHCLIIPSEMHFMEEEALNRFKI
jgi:diphthine synthase